MIQYNNELYYGNTIIQLSKYSDIENIYNEITKLSKKFDIQTGSYSGNDQKTRTFNIKAQPKILIFQSVSFGYSFLASYNVTYTNVFEENAPSIGVLWKSTLVTFNGEAFRTYMNKYYNQYVYTILY